MVISGRSKEKVKVCKSLSKAPTSLGMFHDPQTLLKFSINLFSKLALYKPLKLYELIP